ncbi:helix-turn-helix transcriptional regulator [Pectinatus frisingensis]|uniref:helix-turn-helix transcriptional regulator n=1 Tax=Pectinatus frisingensis TaxID=865 RepID=UPI0018C7E4B3|nr:helix-turn-helix transcriptional regulator [Pectinatus frisingensis]
MQKKCRRCGELFTPVDGEVYCEKCGGTAAVAMPDERPEIKVPETKICTIREAREKAVIDKKTISDKLQINVSTYHNYESKGYMPKNLFLQFCAIVSMPPEQIKCREPMKPFRPKCVTKHKNPAGFTPKSVPEVKQVVSESVESVNKAFQETAKLSNIASLDMFEEIQNEAYKIRSLHFAITLASEAGLPKNDLIDAMSMFDDILKMHCDNISKRI